MSGNGVPLNVELSNALQHMKASWEGSPPRGVKVAYLYCIGLRALDEHVHPRMALSADDYVMYVAKGPCAAHAVAGYSQLLARMPACIPIFPVASVSVVL